MEIQEVEQENQKTNPGEEKDAAKNTAAKSGKKSTTKKSQSPSHKEAQKTKETKGTNSSKAEEKSNNSKTVKVSVDNSPDEVVELNNQGVELYFDDTKDRFLELPPHIAEDLGFYNKQRYFTARNIVQGELDLSKNAKGYRPQPGQATAAEQMTVYGKDSRYHYCWKRPDELRQAERNGYRVANDPNLDTFYGDVGSSHTVGEKGQEELVLMKLPKDVHEQRQADVVNKSKVRRASVEDNAMNDLKKGGGQPYQDQGEE